MWLLDCDGYGVTRNGRGVSKMAYGFIITVEGRKLLAKLMAGEQLEITRVMVGSGDVEEGQSPAYFTDLVQPVAQATSTLPVAKEDTVSFVVEYRSDLNGGLQEGFWLKEFGVFARDEEKEVLLYYATLGDFPQYVTAYKKGLWILEDIQYLLRCLTLWR